MANFAHEVDPGGSSTAERSPRPIKIGENKNAWIEEEIDAHILAKRAARDAEKPSWSM